MGLVAFYLGFSWTIV